MAINVPRDMRSVIRVKTDRVDDVVASIEALTRNRVLVGIPAVDKPRSDTPVTNATIGYINEFGSPAQNIPPRPFLRPGVSDARTRIANVLKRGLVNASMGKKDLAIAALHAAGTVAVSSVRMRMRRGPFIPLADATLEARADRNTTTGRAGSRKGAIQELYNRRTLGMAPSTEFAKPLIDTSTLLRSITYVLRGRWFRWP